jgi:hypothetical protein
VASPPPEPSSRGSIYEAVHGRRQVRHYLVSEHELASISVMSGAATVLLPLGLFFWGIAATIGYGTSTPLPAGPTIVVCVVLGLVCVAGSIVLWLVRHADVQRIKKETKFD